MTLLFVLLIIAIFACMLFAISYMKKLNLSFNARVLIALAVGIIFGALLQIIVKDKEVLGTSVSWISIVGSAYVKLLTMVAFPLIFISIVKSVAMQESGMGKSTFRIMAVFLITVFIAAMVSGSLSAVFGLNADGLNSGENELHRQEVLMEKQADFSKLPMQEQIVNIIPTNPFYALTGQGNNATLAVVFFAFMIGLAAMQLKNYKKDVADRFIQGVQDISDVIMHLVRIIIRLTPYGVLALMIKITATSDWQAILKLVNFILISYAAMIIMVIVHMLYLLTAGLNPFTFYRKSMSNLLFAFTSRSSAATLPITINNAENNLGVPEGIANLASTLGTSVGQNGCAGVFPAMVAVMIAPTMGINPLSIAFLVEVALLCVLASFGTVGVGGGATFTAIVVLSALNFPVGLVGLLISVEPIIDMGRTALNISDSLLAGVIAAKRTGVLNEEIYNRKEIVD
ncbi:cation:dicarboxylate symporter family transporter [Fenollaria sporofastidiosus]|uniref:cation:dicarboxylate symporter family transporter n=1 Tax=Fenollaria sporofastidiosus TaxID=2811778 RepID=UPI001C003E45|nr:cation:dicarboxylase symporter family transporter [Fenollaria sporofastidiosus]